MIDKATKRWIRNAADERAASRGCRFDESRGQHVIDFAAKYLKLYEGDEYAGKPLIAHPWQVEATMRMFGWVKKNERYGRDIRRFRQGSFWIAKKNFKSPTLAWWGLYLWCADGEPGQKVYLAAKDGQQSREIAGKHVIEMLNQSPELLAKCELNKSLMQLTHLPTRSILKPISSADSKTQKAKEGLNGSILVDETHVVDREFMSRISRAGISRSEPLLIEVSTAGDDPLSYGKERFDYGHRVNKGEVDDDAHLFLAYTAPQDLTDEALSADPCKYGRMANPAWGLTVNEEEFLQDYRQSKESLTTLADFKKYRLNIWQQTSNPLIPMGEWAQCQREYMLADLLGRTCYGGLDLSKTRDTTALFLVFPEDDGEMVKTWCFYWLPRATAERLRNDVGYVEWSKHGHIVLTDGDVVDYNFVRKQIQSIRDQFDLRKVGYDGTYAEQLMQRLAEEDGMPLDQQEKFPQTMMNFAGPTAMLLRMVTSGKLHHPGNPLLTWQIGNTNAKTDANQNMRPVKPEFGDIRTIDGPVAGIMALEMWNRHGRYTQPTIELI